MNELTAIAQGLLAFLVVLVANAAMLATGLWLGLLWLRRVKRR